MTARFLMIRNEGSSTRWDASRYLSYVQRNSALLSEDLRSMVSEERFNPSSPSTWWRAGVTSIHIDVAGIRIEAKSDSGARHFEFRYSGVRKIETLQRVYYMPCLVIQELLVLRNGLLRHTMSDLVGNVATIHASAISFDEVTVQ